jgi:tRNA 2-selenouridine synthase
LIILLTGLTGAGKTECLHGLAAAGEQVLNLELLARHRGSAFGGMGLGPQPSHESFQTAVRAVLSEADPARPLWVEAEGDFIGSVGLPLGLRDSMLVAPRIEIVADVTDRIRRIVATYGGYPLHEWLAALGRVEPRLGPALAHSVRKALLAGAHDAAVELLLGYYDRGYANRNRSRKGRLLGTVTATQPDNWAPLSGTESSRRTTVDLGRVLVAGRLFSASGTTGNFDPPGGRVR